MAAVGETAQPATSSSNRGNTVADGAWLFTEFREALADPRILCRFTTHGFKHVPEEVWRKAFLWACASGRMDFVNKFATHFRNPSLGYIVRDSDQYTALHRAVVGGHLRIVSRLSKVTEGAFRLLHARTHNGWTALHLAVCAKNVEMVDLLMKLYDNLSRSDRAWDFRDDMWMTPLQYGVVGGCREVVLRLLDSSTFRDHVNAVDYFSRSALHMACAHGDHVLVKKLLDNDSVDPNSIDCCAYTPLHWAVHMGKIDVVRAFTDREIKRTIRMSEVDSQGRSVLQIALENSEIHERVRKDIEKVLLTVTEVKDQVERLYRDRQVFVFAANATLVGAALIASVTFGGWLHPPSGPGSPSYLQVFCVFNGLSFFFAMATVLAGAATVLPMSEVYIGNSVRSIRRSLALTSILLLISVACVLVAFVTAGFTSQSTRPNMVVTISLGFPACVVVLIIFLKRVNLKVLFRSTFSPKESKHRLTRSMHDIKANVEKALDRLAESTETNAPDTSVGTESPLSNIKKREERYPLRAYLSSFAKFYEEETMQLQQGGREKILGRMKGFEKAFRRVRRGLDEDEATLNLVTMTKLCFFSKDKDITLDFWSEFPSETRRQRALEKDMESWKKIEASLRAKTETLADEEKRLFLPETRSFDMLNI